MRMRRIIPATVIATALLVTGWHSSAQNAAFSITPHHVGISVGNLEESIAWYERVLDFEHVVTVPDADDRGMTLARLRRDDFYIELFEVPNSEPMPEYRRDPSDDLAVHGVKHFGFLVEDALSAAAILQARGAEISMGPIENERSIFVFISDNSGNSFELIQPKG